MNARARNDADDLLCVIVRHPLGRYKKFKNVETREEGEALAVKLRRIGLAAHVAKRRA